MRGKIQVEELIGLNNTLRLCKLLVEITFRFTLLHQDLHACFYSHFTPRLTCIFSFTFYNKVDIHVFIHIFTISQESLH